MPLLAVICLLAAAAQGSSSPPPDPSAKEDRAEFRAACESSAFRVCTLQAISGNRAAVRTCMIKNISKLSPECQAVVRAHTGLR
jgi:hypothetical protein